jgi:hypothetical protein
VLGAEKDPHKIIRRELEPFVDTQGSGAIDAHGRPPAPEKKARPVRARAVEADVHWLRWVCNWGTGWQDDRGRHLLREIAGTGRRIGPVCAALIRTLEAAGGWKGTEALQRCYLHADEETMLAVVMSGAELREVRKACAASPTCTETCTLGLAGRARSSKLLSYNHGAWRSPVARLLWEQEVPGSNPGAPIRANELLDRGSYCRDCGGITIEDALVARRTTRKGGTRQTPAEAEAIYQAMAVGEDHCRRCGTETLAGTLHAMRARRKDAAG